MRYILIFFLVVSYEVIGQIDLYNSSLTDTTKSILYRGYDNYLKIEGIQQSNLVIVTNDKDTLKYHNDAFHYYSSSKRGSDTLTILKNNEKISEKVFVIKHLKSPTIYLGNIRDSLVTKNQLLTSPGLFVSYEPQLAKSDYRILKFKINIHYNDYEDLDSGSLTIGLGSKFDDSQISAIKRMRSGDVLKIEYVEMICPDCRARRLRTPNLIFKIK
tara:strand:- start:1149 stop:1793 length:645 start_codon:yes stop_codon:yes gene_type:complete